VCILTPKHKNATPSSSSRYNNDNMNIINKHKNKNVGQNVWQRNSLGLSRCTYSTTLRREFNHHGWNALYWKPSSRIHTLAMRTCRNQIHDLGKTGHYSSRIIASSRLMMRYLATSTPASTSTSSKSSSSSSRKNAIWKRIALVLKFLRIPALVTSVYGLGYQQGITDFAYNPDQMQGEILKKLIMDVGGEEVQYAIEGTSNTSNSNRIAKRSNNQILSSSQSFTLQERLRVVASVGERIIVASREYLKKHPEDFLTEEQWMKAQERIGMKSISSSSSVISKQPQSLPWSFFLIKSSIPNAFVSELLPRCIFVTTALMDKYIQNQEELGLVLGHEVSHMIHGHVTEQNKSAFGLDIVEILLLSMDPTEGALSIAFLYFLRLVRTALEASHSRENEREADAMGLKIAAMACLDTHRAAEVFRKMSLIECNIGHDDEFVEYNKEDKDGSSSCTDSSPNASPSPLLSFANTHPPSMERYNYMKETSKFENAEKYSHLCTETKQSFSQYLKLSGSSLFSSEKS